MFSLTCLRPVFQQGILFALLLVHRPHCNNPCRPRAPASCTAFTPVPSCRRTHGLGGLGSRARPAAARRRRPRTRPRRGDGRAPTPLSLLGHSTPPSVASRVPAGGGGCCCPFSWAFLFCPRPPDLRPDLRPALRPPRPRRPQLPLHRPRQPLGVHPWWGRGAGGGGGGVAGAAVRAPPWTAAAAGSGGRAARVLAVGRAGGRRLGRRCGGAPATDGRAPAAARPAAVGVGNGSGAAGRGAGNQASRAL